jgi:hypothetical protein
MSLLAMMITSEKATQKAMTNLRRYIAARRSERSVPGRTRRARLAQGACKVSRPWWSSTLKLATVSQRGLGARRTATSIPTPFAKSRIDSVLGMPRLSCREEVGEQTVEEQREGIPASLALESTVSLALWSPYGTEDETLRHADEGGQTSMIIYSTTRSRNASEGVTFVR